MFILPIAVVDFRIYRIQLGLPGCGGGIDAVDHVVLPLFPRRRRARIHDRRRAGWRLSVSLHHFAAAGLRAAHGRNRALVVLAIVMYAIRKVDWYERDAA